MLRLSINSELHGQSYIDCENQSFVDAIINSCDPNHESYNGHWGNIAWTETIPAIPAVYDQENNLLQEEVPEQQVSHDATVSFTVEDVTELLAQQARAKNQKALGKAAREACANALDLITGYNIEANHTGEQVSQQVATFGPIIQALTINRPTEAKNLISAVTPDGVILTDQLKSDVLNELKDW